MKKVLLSILAIFVLWVGYMYINLKPGRDTLSPEITFLKNQPEVDGLLDEDLKDLIPRRKYDFRFNLNLFKGSAGSNYRIAYGTNFIYLFLEAKADSFICRDRGYQNGDGFILTISDTKTDSDKTDEHYVMGFSSQYVSDQKWAEKILWNYNGKVMLTKLTDDVLFNYQVKDGKIGFELVIPWSELYPYHPFLSDEIGFNLWFVKAHKNRQFPNVQGVSFEFPSETGARRYKNVEFEKPGPVQNCQTYLVLEKNHIYQGENLNFKIAALSDRQLSEEFDISIYCDSGRVIMNNKFSTTIHPGISNETSEFDLHEIVPGNYKILWSGLESNSSGKLKLTILPDFNYESVVERLNNVKPIITEGSYTTLLFYLQNIKQNLQQINDYEDDPGGLEDILRISRLLEQIENGNDTISTKTGIFRRAFRSDLDNTIQPYKIQIPENYNKSENYPLLVFLHGSGRTDEYMFDKSHQYLSQGNFIQIAPKARGVSHYYGTEKAQIDIQEAIRDAIKNYSVDTSNIILAGFSMGGYGVYRTFIDSPNQFKGLAVFSGLPKVGRFRRTGKGEYPNFMKKKNYEKLSHIPIFIYHGKNDLNCPFELTNQFVGKLQEYNENIKFIFDEGTGHSSPNDPDLLEEYYTWLHDLKRSNGSEGQNSLIF